MRMTELAAQLLLSPSGVTRRLDRLVRQGLVTRRSCPSDGRGSLAELSARGVRRLESAAPTHVRGVRRYVIDPLSGRALEELRQGLGRITRALDGHPDENQSGPGPRRTSPPRSIQPLVPPATDSAG